MKEDHRNSKERDSIRREIRRKLESKTVSEPRKCQLRKDLENLPPTITPINDFQNWVDFGEVRCPRCHRVGRLQMLIEFHKKRFIKSKECLGLFAWILHRNRGCHLALDKRTKNDTTYTTYLWEIAYSTKEY